MTRFFQRFTISSIMSATPDRVESRGTPQPHERGTIAESLILTYLEPDPYAIGLDQAKLRGHHYHVWGIMGAYNRQYVKYPEPIERLARHYGIPEQAVQACQAYYNRHKRAIDARLVVNASLYELIPNDLRAREQYLGAQQVLTEVAGNIDPLFKSSGVFSEAESSAFDEGLRDETETERASALGLGVLSEDTSIVERGRALTIRNWYNPKPEE